MESKITIKGTLVLDFTGGAHYELEADKDCRYVLFGNLEGIDKLNGNQVEIEGTIMKNTVNIYMRGIPFEVQTIKVLNLA